MVRLNCEALTVFTSLTLPYMKEKSEILLFEDEEVKLEVNLKDETVWLNRHQLSELFDRDIKTIGKHINNALNEELKDIPTVANFATVQKEGNRNVTREIDYYNLDMIISVGYRVKSKNGVIFRKWANKILKDYLIKGYSVNQKRLEYLEKTIKLIDIAEKFVRFCFTDISNKNFNLLTGCPRAMGGYSLDDNDKQNL